jgi:glycosyltransferase involved in cell wall biosynthesis
MNRILWLASWYPNEMDIYAGDFIQRQAEAVSLINPVDLIFVGKHIGQAKTSSSSNLNTHGNFDNLHERILYYYSEEKKQSVLTRLKSFYDYFNTHVKEIGNLKKKAGLPDLIHVQVAMRSGLVALYLKWKYKIPYVVTEHWSGYYSQSMDTLFKRSFLERFFTIRILRNASCLLPVSQALGQQIHDFWAPVRFQPIPNVVNTKYFFYEEKREPEFFRFIHVSSLKYPKNPEAIIRSFIELQKSGFHAEIVLVGPANPELMKIIDATGLYRNRIHSTGELPYAQVATELKKSNALVMFSSYENLPCVILEALCAGVPVISSRVGGVPEIINHENGIMVDTGNEDQLLDAMKMIIKEYKVYNTSLISKKAVLKFSYESVAKQIIEVYDSVLNNREQ